MLLRPDPSFRLAAFRQGLEARGFEVITTPRKEIAAGDVLVIWNRQLHETTARRFERAGAKVLIAENGYLGREWQGSVWYALSLGHHNGAGAWPMSDSQFATDIATDASRRWDGLGVDVDNWRPDGDEIVILAQRGIGEPGVREPHGWSMRMLRILREAQQRPVRVRTHPGESKLVRSLDADLANAWCCVTWASGAALKAIVMGVPVFHGFANWIGASAARSLDPRAIESPFRGDRLPMLRRLAWAMWSIEEISSGEPFRCLLGGQHGR